MKIIVPALILLLTAFDSARATAKTVTFFSDGAMVEMVGAAVKGVAEIPIPAEMMEGTLRITPLDGAEIKRVDIVRVRLEEKQEKELALLHEQRNRMEDRLQALAVREEIFKSAAKSQSGKAPRKTKTNPDPMQAIRQGTDYAIAQLEAVYTAKRRSEQEIRRLDAKISSLRNGITGAKSIAKVTLSSANGKIRARYAVSGQGWTPGYDLRFNNSDTADLILSGYIPNFGSGAQLAASTGRLADFNLAGTVPVTGGTGVVHLAKYRLPVSEVSFGEGFHNGFSCKLTNTGASCLPAGTAALYHNGEYRGKFRFEGISSGRSKKIQSTIN